jgi:hypothetical protein
MQKFYTWNGLFYLDKHTTGRTGTVVALRTIQWHPHTILNDGTHILRAPLFLPVCQLHCIVACIEDYYLANFGAGLRKIDFDELELDDLQQRVGGVPVDIHRLHQLLEMVAIVLINYFQFGPNSTQKNS